MFSLRYLLRLFLAFFAKFKVVLLLGIASGVILFFLVRVVAPLIIPGKTETIGLVGKYHLETLPSEILLMVGDGLTRMDEHGTVMPALADSWETPDKGQTWIFHLKKDVLWQDGKKVTSDSIVYNFSDATIERPDGETIVFKLQAPFGPFPSVVSQPTFKKGLLGTGAWQVKKASVAGSFVQRLTLESDNGERLIFKFYPTEERAKLAFKLGAVGSLRDIYSPVPFDTWKTVSIEQNLNKHRVVAVFFNVQDKLLGEKTLRQALAYAINKENLPGERAYGPISSDSWAFNPQVKPYAYDAQRAREIIEELPEELTDSLPLKLVTSPVLLETADKIVKDWEAVGLKTELQVTSGIPTEYQAFLAIYDIPKDPDQYAIWHSTQVTTNISRYQNPRIDKLLEDGRGELSQTERRKIYLDFQRFLVEDSPAIFLYHPASYTIVRK